MPSNLHKGSTIISASKKRGKEVTYTQTGKQAKKNIEQKYGKIVPSAYYYHRGNGNWARWDEKDDITHKRKTKKSYNKKYAGKKKHMGDSKRKSTSIKGRKVSGRV